MGIINLQRRMERMRRIWKLKGEDDNRDNNSYLAFARTIITVAPTLCHGKEYEVTKFYTTKIIEYYRKLTKIIYD